MNKEKKIRLVYVATFILILLFVLFFPSPKKSIVWENFRQISTVIMSYIIRV